ncbi:ferredoxin--NADP+ reductase [Neorhizobium galegae]|uniref:ferredoxin--NADP reductase n=1 Tax=Neorhizobium galegae TaxID=399 RepID=UPI00277EF0A3|nr:ferredoxin--NADP reductase [Neorhizobium galegae]MDQ0135302.1 ferredoxin--NADP+ reductase [Neorhizobium galegae]
MNAPAKTDDFVAAETPAQGLAKIPDGVYAETVLAVEHYTDRLFRFRMTRPAGFRFRSGEFAMIGLMVGDKPVYRAYSIASPSWDEELEFFSIKVPDGPLTSHLQAIKPGDTVLMRKKPTGTLVLDALTPGKRLYMFSTGTGIAPFASLIRDPETYEKFEEVILTHTCRDVAELKYGFDLVHEINNHEFLAEIVGTKLKHYATVTREDFKYRGRITDLIENGKLFADLGVPALDPAVDRGMICGSTAMLKDTKDLLEKAGLVEGSNNKPGEFVIERAFVG